MRHVLTAFLALATAVAAPFGLAQGQQGPVFEAASIKKSAAVEHGGGRSGLQPGGRFVMTNGPTRILLGWAWRTQTGEILGAPEWVTTDNYDVEARAGKDVSFEELAVLMRTLLADRFKLKAHLETRVRPMYELRVARPGRLGPALKPATVNCDVVKCTTTGGDGTIESNGTSIGAFATWLPARTGRPVIDKTGLTGDYQFTLTYSTGAGDTAPAMPTALREQLGLTLEAVDAPTEVLVIDHIERPSEN